LTPTSRPAARRALSCFHELGKVVAFGHSDHARHVGRAEVLRKSSRKRGMPEKENVTRLLSRAADPMERRARRSG
jgi:hypothetical protein